jgi:integrase
MDITQQLKEKRPEISDSSLKTYTSLLKALHKRVFGDSPITMKNFEKTQAIIDDIKDRPVSTRKTILSALYVLTEIPRYNELMREWIAEYRNDTEKREMNDKQKAAFKTQDEIREIVSQYKKRADLLYKKAGRNVRDVQDIQDYIILCLVSGLYIPPRRAEWVKFKTENFSPDDDNFIRGGKEFVFNDFKTAKSKGQQIIEIPTELRRILKKWLAINPTEWLLHDVAGNPLNATKLNQRLVKIFGKGGSVNMMRHSYLSSKYQGMIEMEKEMAAEMDAMGSSKKQADIYVQKIV